MKVTTNLQSPNKTQLAAITHPPGPLMILAGAGTGKTFTLEKRILYLIQNYNVDPKHILAITYTEKAARELKSRITHEIPHANNMNVNTFHSFCFKLLKEFGYKITPQLLDTSEAIHMFLEKFDKLQPFSSDEFPMDPQRAVTESFIPFFNRMRDELIDPKMMLVPEYSDKGPITLEIANQLKDLKRIFPLFQSWKKKMNVVDYGDMILLTYDMLSSNSDILNTIQNQFRHIIVDEFQDNNFALNEIINLISGNRKFITVVGDDDQVIYSFRGANSYNIKAFEMQYGNHKKYGSIALESNYRSSQPILDLANASINNNIDRMEKTLKSALKIDPIKPSIFWGTKDDQLEFLISEINNLYSDNTPLNNIAVLCRTHGQVKNVITNLSKSGIPVIPHYRGLFNCKEIRDILAWCQVIAEGTYQDSALYRIIKRNCSEKTAYEIYSNYCNTKDHNCFKQIEQNKLVIGSFPQLKIIIKTIQRFKALIQKRSAGELVWEITEYLKTLKISAQRYSLDDHYILLNVGNFLKRAQEFSRRNKQNNNLKSFVIYVEAIMRSGGLPAITPASYRKQLGVIVNTIHGVKGAEFPIVFLPFLRQSSFPLNFRTDKKIKRPPDEWLKYSQSSQLSPKEHHTQEERRLFYVAVTRAQKRLFILAPTSATSPFIKELPHNLMEKQPMKKIQSDTKTHSDLKIKYEKYLQKALSREEYDVARDYSVALGIIHQHEKGLSIKLGNTAWEKELKNDLKQEFQPKVADFINLSASAIDMYEKCPLKFRLGRIDGIPQTAKKPELIFGNIIHLVLQRFHKPEKDLTVGRIMRILDEEWKSGDFDYLVREEKFREQGQDILKRYQSLVFSNPPNVIKREEPFSFNIGKITIRGVIDRIDKTSDGISIVDYKTSKSSTPAKSSLQLAIYSMYLEQLDDELIGGIPSSSTLHFLRDEEKPIRAHEFTRDELGEKKEKIIEVASGIRNRDFVPKTGKHCDWCDYKFLACPAWEE